MAHHPSPDQNQRQFRPFGSWPSPVTPEWIGGLREFSELSWSGDGRLLWVERHSNQSRLMAWEPLSGEISNLSGGTNLGGGINFGGGSYHACQGRIVWIEKESQQLVLLAGPGSAPIPIQAPAYPKSSPRLSPAGPYLIYIDSDGSQDAIRIKELSGNQASSTLVDQSDFYNYLRFYPGGDAAVWISWNHPHMPWELSQLGNSLLPHRLGIGPPPAPIHPFPQASRVSILQPEFSPEGDCLAFLADADGWWQIYLYQIEHQELHQLTDIAADHALPPWLQNQTFFGFSPDSARIYCMRNARGFSSLWQLDLTEHTESQIELDPAYTWLESLAVNPDQDQIALVASGGRKPPEILLIDPRGDQRVLRRSEDGKLDPACFSLPGAVSLPNPSGDLLQGLFYPPQNPDCQAGGKPPLLVIVHSGPTRQQYAEFQPKAQYFTSRGYAVLEANYRGSTGYGREYWEALRGQWGILDVEDVYHSALALAGQGLIDQDRIALLGSSSGGLTVLQLLVNYPDTFQAGISLYGVTNLLELVKDPPQFERHYHEWLVGDPVRDVELYRARSPLTSADAIRTPVAIFQGGQDRIVPVEQSEQFIKALERNRVPYEYYLYPEEGHGFKKKENVADFYQKTEVFLRKYLIESS